MQFFDKIYGDIVRTNVFNAVSHFFKINRLLPNYNSNNVILIPKSLEATNMDNWRPITLAKFKFNIFTQLLAYRVASIMPKSIYTHQKGFNQSRNIRKAFDTSDWKFLLAELLQFCQINIGDNWIWEFEEEHTPRSQSNTTTNLSGWLLIPVKGKFASFFPC